MAGHAQLKFVLTECSKTQIRLTQPILSVLAQIQLKSSLSLDLSPAPKETSAISVLHGDDGTVTVQEVNKVQEGDTTITEWKKVRRTQSRTEERETDTIKEKMVTSPGGNTSVYEKDVSKTKRKITSRGSDYFTRNNYNMKRLKDFEGTETVQHELTSVSENLSVTKNESWGSESKAKLVLNKDGKSEQNLKAITPNDVPEPDKDGKDVTSASVEEDKKDSIIEKIERRPSGRFTRKIQRTLDFPKNCGNYPKI